METEFKYNLMALLMGLVVFCLPVVALHADDYNASLSAARTKFLQGVDGDQHAVRDATRQFKKLSHLNLREPVLMAYLGACETLKGRDAANNLNKRRLTTDGINQVDRALKLLDDTTDYPPDRRLDTQLVAANSFIHIPAFFNRYQKGRLLIEQILADSNFDLMAAGFRAATYMAAALVAQGDNDETAYRKFIELTLAADPTRRDGRMAVKLRDEYSR